jgi:hypothetical protein
MFSFLYVKISKDPSGKISHDTLLGRTVAEQFVLSLSHKLLKVWRGPAPLIIAAAAAAAGRHVFSHGQ